MAKFFGKVGFAISDNTKPGVWTPSITEREYFGDWNRNLSRFQSESKVNDDLTISNELSIVADPFAMDNFHTIRYVKYAGAKWKVNSVEVQFPRLILTIGGVYNGDTPRSSQPPLQNA